MRIVLTGATGFLGGHVAQRLISTGHDLMLLVRNPARARARFPGAANHGWDGLLGPPPTEAFAGVEAVIHLAGESVAGRRWSANRRRLLRDSRVLATRQLMSAMGRAGESSGCVVIGASAVGYYGDRGDEVLHEDSAPGSGFLAELCVDWEAALREGAPSGTRVVSLRTGLVLGRDGGALPLLARVFKAGLGGPIGGGRQWMSWIHVEDLVSLIENVLTHPAVEGPVNAVSPQPARNVAFTRALAAAVHRPAVFPVPAPLLKLVLGEMSSLLLFSQRVSPTAAEAAGYPFRYTTLEAAFADLLRP